MSTIDALYRELRVGLEMTPGPADVMFSELWEVYTEVTHLAGCRLMEPGMGGSLAGAEEVQLHMVRFQKVAKISRGMPLRVPAPAVRSLRAVGRLLEATPHLVDVADWLQLSAPIPNDFCEFAGRELGRGALPVLGALTVVARSGTLMVDCLRATVPGFGEE